MRWACRCRESIACCRKQMQQAGASTACEAMPSRLNRSGAPKQAAVVVASALTVQNFDLPGTQPTWERAGGPWCTPRVEEQTPK